MLIITAFSESICIIDDIESYQKIFLSTWVTFFSISGNILLQKISPTFSQQELGWFCPEKTQKGSLKGLHTDTVTLWCHIYWVQVMLWNTHHSVWTGEPERGKTKNQDNLLQWHSEILSWLPFKDGVYKASNLPHSPAGLVDTLGEPL